MESFKSYSLFNDVEDFDNRALNRGRILCNIVLDHMKDGKTNMKGVAISGGYMKAIPVGERRAALDQFIDQMAKAGFAVTGSADERANAYEEAVNGR